MPNTFASFASGDIVEATHVSEMHSPIQNLERGAAFYGGTSGGSATAYTVTLSPAPDNPYQAGMLVHFKVHADNEAGSPDVTLNVNSVGAKPILKNNGQSLAPGDLKAGQMATVVYDDASAGSFRLMESVMPMEIFGDGSDGDVTLSSGTLGLTRDRYYRNLTLTGTANIRTDGYRVFVSGVLDLSNANTAALRLDGGNASGTTGGVGRGPNTVGASSAGSDGAAGATGAGAAASAASALAPANGGSGGGTQASGAGINAGVAASAGSAVSSPTDLRIPSLHLLRGASLINAGVGGRGGSSGGGDLLNAGGSGGGGGGGGGVMAIYARAIKTSVSTPAPVIRAVGGDGAAGGAPSAGDCGGGSGGGGGGGGFIYLVMGQRIGPSITNGLRARGGDGGSGGAGTGTGAPGGGGDGGGGGQILQINLGQQTVTVNTGNRNAQAGGAASGATPGTGGIGRSANANL